MKRDVQNRLTLVLCSALVILVTGCGNNQHESVSKTEAENYREELYNTLTASFTQQHYAATEHRLREFVERYPDDERRSSCELMLADVLYELEKYLESFERYRHFVDFYPADHRAEYALYKAAHAQFAQATGIACDSTTTEETIGLCDEYLSHEEFNKYRPEIESLRHTCNKRLLDKELYIANAYLQEGRVQSAAQRLAYVREHFDLAQASAEDKVMYYEAKLAQKENRLSDAEGIVASLTENHPQSRFATMAKMLTRTSIFG